ncbi:MAG: hypothetical protein JWP75_3177 [Frondihabitans sp.]|nr:hypothetical protein [Frondihabitans sp.]
MTSGNQGSLGRLVTRAAPWASLAVVALAVPLALSGCTSAQPTVVDTYGGLPSYLPKAPVGTDDVLTGSVKRPALTSEGDSVKVELPGGGTVLATVTGPVVPGEGLPYQANYTTCTWTVKLSDATRNVLIRLSDLTTLDQLGAVYHPTTVPGQAAPPAVLHPGQSTTFELRTGMKVGEGLLRWAPGGSKIVAEWDFEVEND